jgi:hypothetical protein
MVALYQEILSGRTDSSSRREGSTATPAMTA